MKWGEGIQKGRQEGILEIDVSNCLMKWGGVRTVEICFS